MKSLLLENYIPLVFRFPFIFHFIMYSRNHLLDLLFKVINRIVKLDYQLSKRIQWYSSFYEYKLVQNYQVEWNIT